MKSLIAVDLGSKNLHICAGSAQKGRLKVSAAGSFPLPSGVVRGDYIQNVEEIGDVLSNGLKDLGLKGKRALITINATGALSRDILLPTEKKIKKIDSMVANELRLNYNVQDYYVIQYKAIKKDKGDDNSMMSAYRTLSIDESVVEKCRNILINAGLRPIYMDVNSNAVDKLLSSSTEVNGNSLEGGATMLIDFGHHETTAYIYAGDNPLFFRHIPAGSGDIENVLAEETLTDIEEMQENKEGGMNLFGKDDKSQRYFTMMRAFFYQFNDELRNIIKFYNNRYKGVNVDRAYIFGEGSKLTGLPSYWEMSLNIPTEAIKSISIVDMPGGQANLLAYINCLGALIRY